MGLLDALRALAEPSRYRIARLLAAGPLCNQTLATATGLSPPAVSQHLRVLRDAGLVTGERRGCRVHYRLVRPALEQLRADLETELRSMLAGGGEACRHRREEGGEHCGQRGQAAGVQAPGEAPRQAGGVHGGADPGMPRR